MTRTRLILLVFLLLCGLTSAADAAQLHYKQTKAGQKIQFDYSYQGYDGKPKTLSFRIDSKNLKIGSDEYQPFDQSAYETYALEYLNYHAARMKDVKMTVRREDHSFQFDVTAPSGQQAEEAITQMKLYHGEAEDKFLASRLLVRDTSGKYVMPDHVNIARRYVSYMKPVARAIEMQTDSTGARELLENALNFIQSIPYDTLMSRSTSNGLGYTTPYGILQINKGDCDSKSVALISIVRAMMPKMPVIIVFTPNHAFAGFKVPTQKGDRILTIDGKEFVLVEPAGPGMFEVGEIADESSAELDKNQFNYVSVP